MAYFLVLICAMPEKVGVLHENSVVKTGNIEGF
jgi:hypothetical protein